MPDYDYKMLLELGTISTRLADIERAIDKQTDVMKQILTDISFQVGELRDNDSL